MAMSLSGVIAWFVNRVCNSNLLTEKSNILLVEFCPSTPQGRLSELTTLVDTKLPTSWWVPSLGLCQEEEVGELEEGAPNFDAKKEEEAPIPIEDQAPEPAVQGIFDDEEEEAVKEERAPEGEVEEKEKIEEEGEEKKEGESEEAKEFETRVFRLAAPMFSKKAKEVSHTCHHGHALAIASWWVSCGAHT